MRNSQHSSEVGKTDWKAFLERVISKSERPTPHIAHFYGAVPASVTFFEGRPIKLTANLLLPDEAEEQVTVFLDADGGIESIRSVKSDENGFDNGVRRGPERRSLRSRIQLRQDFDAEGRPTPYVFDVPDAHVELYIHTQSFV